MLLLAFGGGLAAQDLATELWAFVSSNWYHGTPYRRAEKFRSQPGAVALVRSWLDDRSKAHAWKNLILTLGIVGTDDDTNRLRTLIFEGSGVIDEPLLRERAAAIQALGFLAHEADVRGESSAAFDFLVQSADPQSNFWKNEVFEWRGVTDAAAREQLTRALGHQVILALSLVGSRRSGVVLDGLAAEPLVDQDVVKDALVSHQAVSEAREKGEGLAEVYERQQPQP